MNAIRTLMTDMDAGVIEIPTKEFFPHLYNELSAFTYKYSANGKISFSHPNGVNDDCVDALWLANLSRNKIKSSGLNAIKIGMTNNNLNPQWG